MKSVVVKSNSKVILILILSIFSLKHTFPPAPKTTIGFSELEPISSAYAGLLRIPQASVTAETDVMANENRSLLLPLSKIPPSRTG